MGENSGRVKDIDTYPMISVTRFICAILVVILHMRPLYDYNEKIDMIITNGICRIAVPYFFISSGFLTFKNKNVSFELIKRKAVRLLKKYIVWMSIYAPYVMYLNIKASGEDCTRGVFTTIYEVLFVGYYHLWFLIAIIIGIIILYFSKKQGDNVLFILAIVAYILGLLYTLLCSGTVYNKYLGTLAIPSVIYGFVFAFPYLTIGYLLTNTKLNFSIKKNIMLLILAILIHLVEILYIYKTYNNQNSYCMTISLTFVTINVFLLTVRKNDGKVFFVRYMNGLMYYSQFVWCIVYQIITKLATFLLCNKNIIDNSIKRCVFVLVCDLIFSYFCIKYSQRHKNSVINLLI